jgi:hypothetical protein
MDTKGAVELIRRSGGAVKGHIPAVDITGPNLTPGPVKLIPWQKAAFRGPRGQAKPNVEVWSNDDQFTKVPQYMVDQMHSGLPPMVRRTASERYEALVKRLLDMGRANTVNGEILWPTSLQRILETQGVKRSADLYTQTRALAKHFIVKSENQQRAKDRKKVVLDYHGHYD